MESFVNFEMLTLGSCAANPNPLQKYCSYLLEIKKENNEITTTKQILFDVGSSHTISHVDYQNLAAIFISHTHLDHIKYLGKLLRKIKGTKRKEPLLLYINAKSKELIKRLIRVNCIGIPKFLQIIEVIPKEKNELKDLSKILQQLFDIEIELKSEYADHPANALAYRLDFVSIVDKTNRFDFVFCPDTAYKEELIPFMKNVDYCMFDTTFDDEGLEYFIQKGARITHCSPRFSGPLLEKAQVKNYVVIHYYWKRFGEDLPSAQQMVRRELSKYFKGNIILTEDLRRFKMFELKNK
jgi:ribonuclease BN (tRNA processing enzyme)